MVRRHLGTWIFWGVIALIGILAASSDIFAGTATTSDDFYVADELEVDGSVDVAGAIAAGGNISTAGDVLATDDLEAGDDVIVGDDLAVSGLANIAETLEVTGGFSALSSAGVGDSLYVGGNMVVGDSLYVTTDARIADKFWCVDLDVSDDLVVDDDLTVTGELLGARDVVAFSRNVLNQTGDNYLGFGGDVVSATDRGLPFARSGSFVGIAAQCNIDSYTPVATLSMNVYKNGGLVYSATHTVAGTGLTEWHATQARGIDTFAADDWIYVKLTVTGTVQYDRPIAAIEHQFDS